MEGSRISAYYDDHPETDRFQSPSGKLELERSKIIIGRHLGPAPRDILDAGGGTGTYSFWLAALGHRVTFLDLSDVHVRAAEQRSAAAAVRLAEIRQGTALALPWPDVGFDMVLNMGPMYHLPPDQRQKALAEMRRVLRPAGLLVSAYISRFAALMDGYDEGYISDPGYIALALGDIVGGRHDPPSHGRYFTEAYMHRPEEIPSELERAGFRVLDLCAVEGVFWTYPNLKQYTSDPDSFSRLLEHAALIEREPSMMGASAHLLSVAMKGGT
jgi:SAM-dependent methyltransferase